MGILTSLDAVQLAPRLVDSMRLADDLAFEASRDGGARTIRILSSALVGDDQVTAIAATHALAGVFDEQADVAISRLLSDDRGFLREHAAWVLGARLPRLDALGRLIGMVAAGGFGGMVAQRTLEKWSSVAGDPVSVALEGALLGIREPDARYRLVETLGLVRSTIALTPLMRIAADTAEPERVRVAAVSALGQRRGDSLVQSFIGELATGEGHLPDVARIAQYDLAAPSARRTPTDGPITVAQLFLHADIDAQLTQAGAGDNGGIATLLVRLGDALVADARDQGIARVLTLSRGSVRDALDGLPQVAAAGEGHLFGRIPTLAESMPSAVAWPLRVAVRRGIRRMLRASGGVDVLHLRMADVGSLAAADVARELEIPVVFTVAPDPHAVIDSMDNSGHLTRWNFGDIDEREHFWFRARLVQQLAANAAHTVLFPRPHLRRDMKELVGIDITEHPERHTVVPEGIDLEIVDSATGQALELAGGTEPDGALGELAELLSALPENRRGLPLVISVGRFHRVKGMATIVKAWANGPLADRANLLLVGGDLDNPSPDESEQLDAIAATVPADRQLASGLILAGHRPNDTVALWMAATRHGIPGLAAARGIYVCGSLKEEFGIALLEAMASGLIVVGPNAGGPATYVEEGVTGFLAPTWDVERLRSAMVAALDAAAAETTDDRAIRSRQTVLDSFTIQAMAAALSEVYARVHESERRMRDWVLAVR